VGTKAGFVATCGALGVLVAAISCEGGLSLQGSADADVVAQDDGIVESDAGRETSREAEAGDEVDSGLDADGRPDADTEAEADVMSEADAAVDAATDVPACDGAWLDPITGYLWEDPPSDAPQTWDDAVVYCNGLTLCGYPAESWHLPNLDELRSLIRGCPATMTGGACELTDACPGLSCWDDPCGGCLEWGGPGYDGTYWDPAVGGAGTWDWFYWSSTLSEPASAAWGVGSYDGGVLDRPKTSPVYFRCVHRDS
jgi:hypothetical protein